MCAIFLPSLSQGGLGLCLQKNESGDSLNIDESFGESFKSVLERGRERSVFIIHQFPTWHPAALSTCSSSERSLKWQKF